MAIDVPTLFRVLESGESNLTDSKCGISSEWAAFHSDLLMRSRESTLAQLQLPEPPTPILPAPNSPTSDHIAEVEIVAPKPKHRVTFADNHCSPPSPTSYLPTFSSSPTSHRHNFVSFDLPEPEPMQADEDPLPARVPTPPWAQKSSSSSSGTGNSFTSLSSSSSPSFRRYSSISSRPSLLASQKVASLTRPKPFHPMHYPANSTTTASNSSSFPLSSFDSQYFPTQSPTTSNQPPALHSTWQSTSRDPDSDDEFIGNLNPLDIIFRSAPQAIPRVSFFHLRSDTIPHTHVLNISPPNRQQLLTNLLLCTQHGSLPHGILIQTMNLLTFWTSSLPQHLRPIQALLR